MIYPVPVMDKVQMIYPVPEIINGFTKLFQNDISNHLACDRLVADA
jgi:hypothetical protein